MDIFRQIFKERKERGNEKYVQQIFGDLIFVTHARRWMEIGYFGPIFEIWFFGKGNEKFRMYDGCGACWTDFCHLIFREGNEKFHTRMCVCVCVCTWMEWSALWTDCWDLIFRKDNEKFCIPDGYWLLWTGFRTHLLGLKVSGNQRERNFELFYFSSLTLLYTWKQTRIIHCTSLELDVALKIHHRRFDISKISKKTWK